MELDITIKTGIDEQLASVSSPHVFALTVRDTTMIPDLNPGDIVIIDPNIKPQPGEIILVKLDNEILLLRRYRPLEPISETKQGFIPFELVATNPNFPVLKINNAFSGRIIGTLIEHRCKRRLAPPKPL